MVLAAGASRDLIAGQALERREPDLRERLDRRAPRVQLRRVAGRPHPAVVTKLRVDPVLGAEASDGKDRLLGLAQQAAAFLTAAHGEQCQCLRHPCHDEPAVAAARATAADVGLDDGDVGAGLELLDPQRAPEPGESATDDAHVRAPIRVQRPEIAVLARQCLLEPEALRDAASVCHVARAGKDRMGRRRLEAIMIARAFTRRNARAHRARRLGEHY